MGRWDSTDSVTLEIGPRAEGKVSLVNCSFWGPIDRCVVARSPSCQFTAIACHFAEWDNQGIGSPAIQLLAGRAIVQGCTFQREGQHVEAGAGVRSVILTGNQAEGGFRVDNRAGVRTLMALNEPDTVRWTPAARANYRLAVGALGDARYLYGWHLQERDKWPFRWSNGASQLRLPMVPGRAAVVTMQVDVPGYAQAPDAGLYLGGKRIAVIRPGVTLLTARIPATGADRVTLELRCRPWVPLKEVAGSGDNRTLGARVGLVTVRAEGVAPNARPFDANTGR